MSNEHEHAQPANPETLGSFKRAAAAVVAKLFESRQITEGVLYEVVHYTLGISTDPTFEGRVATITVVEADEHATVYGIETDELTPAAQAKRDAQALRSLRASFWEWLKERAGRGYFKTDVTEILDELGYQARPESKTYVSGIFRTPGNYPGDEESFSFTLKGEHKKEDVRAKVNEYLGDDPGAELVAAQFPGAENVSTRGLLNSFSVRSEKTWPAVSEFHGEE